MVATAFIAETPAVLRRFGAGATTPAGKPAPGLESPPPDQPLSTPTGDFSNPPGRDNSLPADPKHPDKKVSRRTPTSTTFDNGDGTSTVHLHQGMVNWQDRDGVWRAIDTRLKRRPAGDFETTSTPAHVKLAGATGERPMLTVATDDWSLAYRPVGLVPGRPAAVDGGRARYNGARPGIDIEHVVLNDRVKETIVLNERLAAGVDPSFRFLLDLEGIKPEQREGGSIAFVRPDGTVVAEIPRGVAMDSNPERGPDGSPPNTAVDIKLVKLGATWAVDVSVDRGWLNDPARVYPVLIDPTTVYGFGFFPGRDSTGGDAFAGSGCGNCTYNGAGQWDVDRYVNKIGKGNYNGGYWEFYSYLFWDLAPLMGHTVLDADLWGLVYSATGGFPTWFNMHPISQSWSPNTVNWTNKPNHNGQTITVNVQTVGERITVDVTSWMQNWLGGTWPSWGIEMDTQGNPHLVRLAAMEEGAWSYDDPYLAVQVNNTIPYHDRSQLVPAHDSTVTTATPTLSAPVLSDPPENDQIQYWFRIGTLPDAETGETINSGWLNSPTFKVPAGALHDGVTYYWKIFTRDEFASTTPTYSSWPPATLKVDLRLDGGPSPTDSMGPVSVNLATGNAGISTASPTFDTVGGPIGLTFDYDSAAPGDVGLVGTYVDSADTRNRLIRQDRSIDFSWAGSPGPGIPATDYTVTWKGFVRVPTAGSWQFGAVHDDAAKITVGSTVALNTTGTGGPHYGSAVTLGASQSTAIQVELTQGPGSATMQLYAKGPGYTGIVPADWLSTGNEPLPARWRMSAAGASELAYTKAVLSSNEIVLHEPSGAVHNYIKQADGTTWKPTNVNDDIVTSYVENGARFISVEADDGITYTFDSSGRLVRARSSLDDEKPAAPEYVYNVTTGRLDKVVDPVSQRELVLTYAPSAGGAGSCPTTGFSTPPAGMLCKLAYPDGSEMKLFYNANGQLARIEDPGAEITDFAYNAKGLLSKVRDPLAYDAVSAPAPHNRANDDTTLTLITYDETAGSAHLGKVTSVELAKALATDTTRAKHSYRYTSISETKVDIAGVTPPTGRDFARKVTFDQGGRALTDTGLDGLVASQEWDSADRVLSSTDTTGRKTTTIYDHAGRPTDTYGPAPAAWFGSNRLPLSQYTAQVPRSTTEYDRDIAGNPFRGLAAAYWDNATLSGSAKLRATGVGQPNGELYVQWSYGGPPGLGVTDNFSARFTGEITFPGSGYKLTACGNDGTRVWIDDVLVTDGWNYTGCKTSTWTSPSGSTPRRIRVESMELTGASDVQLRWTPSGSTTDVLVPGDKLAPRYGLATAETDPDGRRTVTEYGAPESGLPTKTIMDPFDATVDTPEETLATEVKYERRGDGYRRRTTRRLPANTYDGHVRADNPAAYWRLGETQGPTAYDSSGNNRHATQTGDVEYGNPGILGVDNATEFDYQGASAGDIFDMTGRQAFTVETWARFEPDASGYQFLVSKEGTFATGREGWALWAYNGFFGFDRFSGGSSDSINGGTYRPGQWNHVAGWYDGNTMRLFVNGTEVASRASTRSIVDTTAPMMLGRLTDGDLDEAAVYTSALPTWRVEAHWRAASRYIHSALADTPSGYWRLTETGGTVAHDTSGNGRHATYVATTLDKPGIVDGDTAAAGWGSVIAEAGDFADAAGTAAFSVEAWVKPDVVDGNWRRIVSKEASDANGRQGWSLWIHQGTVGFERYRDNNWNTASGGSVPAGVWTHVAARYSGSSMRVFVNGVEVGSVSSSLQLLDTTAPMKIGHEFVGSMTHAAVYPVSLGSGVVLRHYRDGAVGYGATGTQYYGATETRANPCAPGTSAVQSGLSKTTIEPDPDVWSSGIGRSEETVYDVMSRVVASRVNAESWSCMTYDSRGRTTMVTVPAYGTEPGRTITNNYAVGGDPLTTSVGDTAGTVTTKVDLLGRVISYTDVWGNVTTTAYDQAGRVTQTNGPAGQLGTDYHADGRVDAQRRGGSIIADPTYNAAGELVGVSYPAAPAVGNGTSLAIDREASSGRPTKLTWSQAGGFLLTSDEVAYSVGGQVKDQKIDGVDHHAGDDFAYDSAGRLTATWVPGHSYTYNFGTTSSCGSPLMAIGRNTNRTAMVTDGGTPTTYCYDEADRLKSTSDSRYATVAYDARGNTTTLGNESMVYDGANRHVATTKGATTVRYGRDVTDRIVERKVNGATVARYAYSASGDTGDATLDANGTVIEATVPLLGGVTLTTRLAGADVWSYPNIHGDVVATANAAGLKQGATLHYDPYGTPLTAVPDNSAGNFDYGWLGQHQRPVETEAGLTAIEMGARLYLPGLGRFLQVDPIEGGSANDYDYVMGDPANDVDLDGERCRRCRKNRSYRSGRSAFSRSRMTRGIAMRYIKRIWSGRTSRRVGWVTDWGKKIVKAVKGCIKFAKPGAVAGGAAGAAVGNPAAGALIGAGVGCAVGAVWENVQPPGTPPLAAGTGPRGRNPWV